MKDLIRGKAFKIGFLVGLLIIGLLNKFTADFSQVTEFCMYRQLYGFPFLQFEDCQGLVSITRRYLLGMNGNMLFAIIFSFLIGFVFQLVWSKINQRNLS